MKNIQNKKKNFHAEGRNNEIQELYDLAGSCSKAGDFRSFQGYLASALKSNKDLWAHAEFLINIARRFALSNLFKENRYLKSTYKEAKSYLKALDGAFSGYGDVERELSEAIYAGNRFLIKKTIKHCECIFKNNGADIVDLLGDSKHLSEGRYREISDINS